ncbi:MAG: hypothetical protein NW216_12240 [Hyphomicrobium sp.]|nr:hypothetical protein [Hyphomicrobium sp.]
MRTYYARMMDAATGGEGSYRFEGPEDLMKRTADEVVTVFFEAIGPKILESMVDWEVNGALKNRDRGIVTAMGALIPDRNEPDMPFLLMISDRA